MPAEFEVVQGALSPYHGKIHGCIVDGFAEWRDTQNFRMSKGYAPNLYSRTNSNDIFDAIMRRAIPLFGAEDRVLVRMESQTAKFMFRGIVARFKKAGDDGLGCNIRTQAAMAFMDAETPLPGLPAETAKIELIWEPNEIWTQVERVLVVARDGDRMLWEYEITGEPVSNTAITISPTDSDDRSDDMDDTNLIRPKAKPQAEPKAR